MRTMKPARMSTTVWVRMKGGVNIERRRVRNREERGEKAVVLEEKEGKNPLNPHRRICVVVIEGREHEDQQKE